MSTLFNKIVSIDKIIELRQQHPQAHWVFTNGCFDILHTGHVLYLEKAKELGDYLIVALNSDKSVSRLKGDGRPVNKQEHRAIVLAGLASVDAVILFEEDSPGYLLKILKPDYYVKGGDHTLTAIPEVPIAEEIGIKIVLIPPVEGESSSNIIRRIISRG